MANKFIIFYNDNFEPYIILSNVNYHREIEAPSDMGRPIGRAGGGKWFINSNGELKLYDLSSDFGKYDKKWHRKHLTTNIYIILISLHTRSSRLSLYKMMNLFSIVLYRY